MKKVIGITGGISTGKSNVISEIRNLGYICMSCDEIVHKLEKIGGSIYNKIIEEFGQYYLDSTKNIDRTKLAKLIFSDKNAKLKLNSITHPLVKEYLINEIKKINDGLIFIEVPLLFEAGFDDLCDKIICIYINKDLQIERLMEREYIDYNYALSKINSQMSLEIKKDKSDYIIDSSKTFENTKKQVLEIIKILEGENDYGSN